MTNDRIVVGISGASGTVISIRLLEALRRKPRRRFGADWPMANKWVAELHSAYCDES